MMVCSNPNPLFQLSLLLFLFLFSSTKIESLRFDLQSSHTKCISEEIKSNSMTVGKYSIVNHNDGNPLPDSHRITVRVTSSYGNNYHYGEKVQSGNFAFVADWSNVAKKGQVDVMELELKKLYETVSSIHDEMFYLREREEEMQELNRTTNTRMFWLSLLSLIVCLSVAGLQLWHLKSFFEKKKLI
ncbi:hypothetical protein PIB30_008790 [Stylosanthes scabra]|uniref:GOLD domain-containing protein n=1 Tax=Stylosanthes scabra TaxID=79078 RepID=A0ABU6W564_9FABA|nr:hypothetical protein [Stylosanthes scabra]